MFRTVSPPLDRTSSLNIISGHLSGSRTGAEAVSRSVRCRHAAQASSEGPTLKIPNATNAAPAVRQIKIDGSSQAGVFGGPSAP